MCLLLLKIMSKNQKEQECALANAMTMDKKVKTPILIAVDSFDYDKRH